MASLRLMGRGVSLMAAAVLWLAPPAGADSGHFIDDDARPSEQALEWLAERDVIDGCDPPANLHACPDLPLSRVQAAKVLVRLAQEQGFLAGERPGTVDHFSDDGAVWDGAAEPFVDHLADLGIVHGCDPPANDSFCPKGLLRRGEITKMVVRTFELGAPDGYPTPWSDTGGQFFDEAARVAAYHGLFDASAGAFDGYQKVTRGEFARLVVAVFAPELCSEGPFTERREASLGDRHPGVSFTAHVYDFDTGCAYSMNPDFRQQTASVFKVMVLGGTLAEAQAAGRELTSIERAWLEPMITESANPPVRDLWRHFGAAPWFTRQAERFGLEETRVVGDDGSPWGRTTTSAYDQVGLLRQVLVAEDGILEERYRREAWELMTSVVPSQTWGVSEGVPGGWTVAQKNGFAGRTANSVGVVYDDASRPDYAVAILSYGWPAWQEGVGAVERIGAWVSSALAD
ncbi:MAG: serine hydrolase [Actinomycetota bacterium]